MDPRDGPSELLAGGKCWLGVFLEGDSWLWCFTAQRECLSVSAMGMLTHGVLNTVHTMQRTVYTVQHTVQLTTDMHTMQHTVHSSFDEI